MKRSNRLRLALALAPFALALGGLEICAFEAAGDGGGGQGGSGGSGQGAGGGSGDMIPKSEADKAFKVRDKAKAEAKASIALFAQALGIDPDDVRIEETGDKDAPYKLVGPNLEEVSATLAEARKSKAGKWEDREKELVETHGRKLATLTKNHQRELSARDAWIEQQAVIDPIRSACVAEKAIDDDEGQFSDIVALLRTRVRVERSVGEEDGRLNLKITVLDEDGKPMLDSKTGQAATVRQLVAEFLGKRPKYRQAQFRSGPGAGSTGAGSGQREPDTRHSNGNGKLTPGRQFFGMPAPA